MKQKSIIEKSTLCSKCGKCRTVCPTFLQETNEISCTRGRVHLSSKHAAALLSVTPALKKALSTCLLCLRCKEHCPNNVDIEEIIVPTREAILDKESGFIEDFILNHIVSRKRPLEWGIKMMGISLRTAEKIGFLARFRRMLEKAGIDPKRQLPDTPKKTLRDLYPYYIRLPENKRKVIYFPGCSASLSLVKLGSAVIETLLRNGNDVIVPDIGCCGMPIYAAGYREGAQKVARRNLEILKGYGVDTIVTSCGSCGYMLRDVYGKILDTPARPFKVMDYSEYLLETGMTPGKNAVPLKATWHDPCHLKRAMGVYQQPRLLLKQIPGVDFIEMEEADACCGAGGSFSLKYYELSKSIRTRKLNFFQRTHADTLITGCPACLIHLRDGFNEHSLTHSLFHPAQIIAMTYNPPLHPQGVVHARRP